MKKAYRRFLSAVCAAAMLSGGAAMLPANAAEIPADAVPMAHLMGDINRDLRVTMADAKLALDYAVMSKIGLMDKGTNEETNAGDINMNGEIEMNDALAIMRYYCQTLVGDQPLWSEIRKVTYHDGTEYDPYYMLRDPEEGEPPVHQPFERRGMYLEIGCAEGKAGETVTVPVYVAGITKLSAFEYVQLIPKGLTLTRITSDLGGDFTWVTDEESGITSWDNQQEQDLRKALLTSAVNPELGIGAYAWMTLNGIELDMKEGMIIANYTYQIPADAKSGDTYLLTADAKKMRFNEKFVVQEDGYGHFYNYQYTMLDGVVAVK